MKFRLICLQLICISLCQAQNIIINPKLLNEAWPSHWITCPEAAQREYGIYHFRKNISLNTLPATFIVHVSADNRYRLFVNGRSVCVGPARGDLFNWFFETVDLAPFLKAGKNTIAAIVWNMGTYAPVAQISNQTAFVLQGNTEAENVINTSTDWKVLKDKSYKPCSLDNGERLNAYMVVGPGDQVDNSLYPWGWEKIDYNDSFWKNAEEITHPQPIGHGTDNRWTLSPRNIPLLEDSLTRFKSIRRTTVGVITTPEFLSGKKAIIIPAHKTISILLDMSVNTASYPELIISKGKGCSVKLTYAEALFDINDNKGDRNDIEHKQIKGNYDLVTSDGGIDRKFSPLWFRAYRYLQLDITTKDEPLTINDIYSIKTGYPLKMNASFSCNDPTLQDIWQTGWQTAKLCAGEAYYDTPYYEQLQYTGDSRIQALISLYTSGDDRLMRKSILDFYHSRTPEGLTQGRYPSNRLQIIPTFSLFWVSMVHDYWMYRKDDAFIEQFLPAIAEVMKWYSSRVDQNKKMLGPMTWWNFVDWDNFDSWGVPPAALKGNSSIITLQYSYTLTQAAELFKAFNNQQQASAYNRLASDLNQATFLSCYNVKRHLIADSPDQTIYSQHAGIWGVLSGALPEHEVKSVIQKILEDKSIGQVTFFYRFYLIQALKKAGMADLYYDQLGPWRDMLKLNLTTFAEKPEPTRSDCHAWSASPNYDFLATICGIVPEEPGFKQVLIQPFLGKLIEVEGTMPHPEGKISVHLERRANNGINAEIILPKSLKGTFIWRGKSMKLHGGKQTIII